MLQKAVSALRWGWVALRFNISFVHVMLSFSGWCWFVSVPPPSAQSASIKTASTWLLVPAAFQILFIMLFREEDKVDVFTPALTYDILLVMFLVGQETPLSPQGNPLDMT